MSFASSVSLLLFATVVGVQPDPAAEVARVRAGWPATGTLIVEFRQTNLEPHWRQEVSYDFATHSWRILHADGKNASTIRTPDGQILRGDFRLRPVKDDIADLSALLDPYLPSFHLAGLIEHPGAFTGIERNHPGEIHFSFMLPNGKRIQALDKLPPQIIETQGGVDKIVKKVIFVTDEQYKPLRLSIQGAPDKVFDLADTSTGTFYVSRNCPPPRDTTALISAKLVPSNPTSFDHEASERRIAEYKRTHGEIRVPVQEVGSTDTASEAAERAGSSIFGIGRTAWVVGGVGVLALGVFAWVRRRGLGS